MESSAAVTALSALAHRSRLAVFRALVQRGLEGAHPGALAEALGLAPATLSFHLKSLAHAGLVEAEPNGRHIRYRACFPAMAGLLAYLSENCCGGDARACLPKRGARRAATGRERAARTSRAVR